MSWWQSSFLVILSVNANENMKTDTDTEHAVRFEMKSRKENYKDAIDQSGVA